jgi:membrane protease YdiL (CAAX protease family)
MMACIAVWLALERLCGGMPRFGTFKIGHFLVGLAGLLAVHHLGAVLGGALGEKPEVAMTRAQSLISEGSLLPVFLGSVILAPLMEEMIFRVFLLQAPQIDRSAGAAMLAITASAAFFSAAHVNYDNLSTSMSVFGVQRTRKACDPVHLANRRYRTCGPQGPIAGPARPHSSAPKVRS